MSRLGPQPELAARARRRRTAAQWLYSSPPVATPPMSAVVQIPFQLVTDNLDEFRPTVRSHLVDGDVTLDFAGCTYMDSSACAALLALHRHAGSAGRTLTIRGLDSDLRLLMAMTRLNRVLDIVPPVEDAEGDGPPTGQDPPPRLRLV